MDAGGDHLPPMDFEVCNLEGDVVIQDTNEENNEVLLPGNWKGVTEKDYKNLQTSPY